MSAPVPKQSDRPRRAVILSGGGARGAYEAGVLRFILDDLPQRYGIEPKFEIVCGTSVGAIHAAFIAATAEQSSGRGPQLVKIWEDLHVGEIFRFSRRDLIAMPRMLFGVRKVAQLLREGRRPDRLFGLLDTGPLEQLVLQAIPWDGIRKNLNAGRVDSVCIAATQLATGRAVIFTEEKDRSHFPQAPDDQIRMQAARLAPVHALASAAIPLLFPSVRVGSRYYADGGLRLNTPLAPALRLGADRVLVIGLSHGVTPSVSEALAQQRTAGFGNPMFLLGKVLNALMLSPVDTDLARLRFVNDILTHGEVAFGPDFLERINEAGEARGARPLRRIDHMVIRPSQDVGLMAGDLLADADNKLELNAFLKMFLRRSDDDESREADLLSYLLFDTAFTTPWWNWGTPTPRPGKKNFWISLAATTLPLRTPGAKLSPMRGDQLARQWLLVQRLGRSRGGVGLSELADDLGCVRRTIYRDLDALMYAGFPVVSEKRDGKVYYRFLDSFKLGDVPFTTDEILALAFGEDLLRTLEGTVFHDSIQSALSKIRSALSSELIGFLDTIAGSFRVLPEPHKRYAKSRTTIEALNEAVLGRRVLRMRYRNGQTGEESSRDLDPYHVWYQRGGLYVIGFDHGREEIRTFAVDRILNLEPTGAGFQIRQGFDFDAWTAANFGVVIEPASRVRVRFARERATQVRERSWHASQQIEERADGGVDLTMEVGGSSELTDWILSFGPGAEVLEPAALRAQVREALERASALYGSENRESDAESDAFN